MKRKKQRVERVIAFEGEDEFIVGGHKLDHVKAGDELVVSADGATSTITNTSNVQEVRCSIFSIRGGTMATTTKDGEGSGGTWSGRDINNNAVSGQVALNQTIQTPCIQDTSLVLNNATVLSAAYCGTYKPAATAVNLKVEEPVTTFKNYRVMTCQQVEAYIGELRDVISSGSTTTGALTETQRAAYDAQLAAVLSYYETTCKTAPPPVKAAPPQLPEWGSFTCEQIKTELKSFAEKIASGTFGDYTEMAQNHLVLGQQQEKTVCAVKTTTVTSTTTINPVFSGGGGFGGALGGGGEEEGGEEVVVEEKKGGNWLLWLIVAGLGIYFVTKKSK